MILMEMYALWLLMHTYIEIIGPRYQSFPTVTSLVMFYESDSGAGT